MVGAGVFRKHGCRVTEFSLCGLRALTLENALLRVTLLLDKGGDIVEFRDKKSDMDVMWAAPAGLRAPFSVMPTVWSTDGNYLDHYEGGWQLLFPAIGDPAQVRGAQLGIHGEACMLPWEWRLLEESDEAVRVELTSRMLRTPFQMTRRLTLRRDRRVLELQECAENLGGVDMMFMWGHHPALGGPFLEGEVLLDIPAASGFTYHTSFHPDYPAEHRFCWPQIDAALDVSRQPMMDGRWAGICCATELSEGWCAAVNVHHEIGFALSFDRKMFPNVWLWMVYEGMEHYPWYGATRCLAMEPYSSVPDNLEQAIRQGTALILRPGESMETRLCASLFSGRGRVRSVSRDGDVILQEE